MQTNNALLQDLAFRLILSVKLLIYTLKNIDPESWKKITKRRFFFILTAQNCSICFLTDIGQYWFKLLSFILLTYFSVFPYFFPFDLLPEEVGWHSYAETTPKRADV